VKNFYAYLAGFLDADGSIYCRLKPNQTYKYDFQVAPTVVFFQNKKAEKGLLKLKQQLGKGYLRYRNDGIIEFTIGDRSSIHYLLIKTLPFLIFKKKQAKLMIKILDFSKKVKSAKDFVKLAQLIDQFGTLNYSKKRTILAPVVRSHLKSKGVLTP